MFRLFLAFGLFFVANVQPVSADLLIANYSDATNNRFSNDPAFIGAGFDFSGVARSENGRWGTLISPNAVLGVQHLAPAPGVKFEFYPNNDPNSTPFEAFVVSSHQIGSTDLNIAILDRNVDASIAVYNFATTEYSGDPPVAIINPDGTTSYQTFINPDVSIAGQRTLVFGISAGDNPSAATEQAVGENLVLGFAENTVFGSLTDNDTIVFQRDAPESSNFLTHESYVQGGDSGAPNFLITTQGNRSELLLLGPNSFRLDAADPTVFQSSGVTYMGNQVEEINTILTAHAIEPAILGDCNFDGVVDFLDVSPFIVTIALGDFLEQADINQDGVVDFLDVSPFIILFSTN